jgi:hypothetical protein
MQDSSLFGKSNPYRLVKRIEDSDTDSLYDSDYLYRGYRVDEDPKEGFKAKGENKNILKTVGKPFQILAISPPRNQ